MAKRREYTSAEILKLLNACEGKLVRGGIQRDAGAGESGAHAFGSHLVSAGVNKKGADPSGPQAGADFIKNRFLNSPVSHDGSSMVSSAWYKKGDMVIRLTEAINSPIGQEALGAMALGVKRVVIHYTNKNTMKLGNTDTFNPKHMSVDYAVNKPAHQEIWDQDIYNGKTGEFIKSITRENDIAATYMPNVTPKDVLGVHLVLDLCGNGGIHIQTLYPSFVAQQDCFEYSIGRINMSVAQAVNGKFERSSKPV